MLTRVNTFFNSVSLSQREGGYAGDSVAKKPTYRAPKFGEWIGKKRGKASLEEISIKVRRSLQQWDVKFHRSSLMKIEGGAIPTIPVLYQLAKLYRVPITAVIERIALEMGLTTEAAELDPLPEPTKQAMHLARWFDEQLPERQKAILSTLQVHPPLGEG